MRLTRAGIWCAGFVGAALCLALPADDEVKSLPDSPGKEATARICLDCHGTGNFRKDRRPREDWADQVAEMVDRGAKGSEKELAEVVEYLTVNFGPDSKVNVNTAPLMELKAVLGLSTAEARAVIEARDTKGAFKTWNDLQKVPNIDAKKIEAKKDVMTF